MNNELLVSPVEAASSLVAAIGVGAVTMRRFRDSVFSEKYGNNIFPTTSLEAMYAVIAIFKHQGIQVTRDLSDEEVTRALMEDGTIVNLSSPNINEQLGTVGGTKVFKDNNPLKAAEKAIAILDVHGIEGSRIVSPMRSSTTKGKMAFVLSDKGFPFGALGFRVSGRNMGGGFPPRWRSKPITNPH